MPAWGIPEPLPSHDRYPSTLMLTGSANRQARSGRGFPQGAFMLQKPLLARQAAAIAGQRSVGADHAMAGHDDADRVLAIGEAGGAYRPGLADAPRELGVADGAAAADLAQGAPHAL